MIQKLLEQIELKHAPVVVGLDPNPSMIPKHLYDEAVRSLRNKPEADDELEITASAIWKFNRQIIDAVADLVPAVKPQIAMYEQFGIPGLQAYLRTLRYCREKGLIVIADVKRGDIGSTSQAYARAHLGRTEANGVMRRIFDADFATVNPYFGTDGIEPFMDICRQEHKGIFILVKTSNPTSVEFQDVRLEDGTPLYELVGKKVSEWGAGLMDGKYSDVGAVVGATYPEQAKRLREVMPHTFILAPGYGAQGATAKDLAGFFDADGQGCIVNSSRGIIAAYQKEKYAGFGPEGFAEAARAAAKDMIEDLSSVI
ncbi:MAG: orotidine-5'-phosphate decarboxylase [Lachnospiraceae bacterium]|nr:orotidine-5'-phosphate decarboxylase [Lachnospiraceae bacterium]